MLGHRKMIKCASAKYYTVALLEISIDGCRIWPLAGKIGQKSSIRVKRFNPWVWDLTITRKNQTK